MLNIFSRVCLPNISSILYIIDKGKQPSLYKLKKATGQIREKRNYMFVCMYTHIHTIHDWMHGYNFDSCEYVMNIFLHAFIFECLHCVMVATLVIWLFLSKRFIFPEPLSSGLSSRTKNVSFFLQIAPWLGGTKSYLWLTCAEKGKISSTLQHRPRALE